MHDAEQEKITARKKKQETRKRDEAIAGRTERRMAKLVPGFLPKKNKWESPTKPGRMWLEVPK